MNEPGEVRSMPGKLTPVKNRPRAPEEAHPEDPSMQDLPGGTTFDDEEFIRLTMMEARRRMADSLLQIVDGLIERAKNGYAGAAKLLFDLLDEKRKFKISKKIEPQPPVEEAYQGELYDILDDACDR